MVLDDSRKEIQYRRDGHRTDECGGENGEKACELEDFSSDAAAEKQHDEGDANAEPQSIAVMACGRRDSTTMKRHDSFASPRPRRMSMTSEMGISTEPTNRLRRNSKTREVVRERKGSLGFIIYSS